MFSREKEPTQQTLKNDIINSQKRAMRILAESELVASKVNVSLKEQGETMVRSRQVTNNIGEQLKKTDKDIRIIKSWFGPFINKLAKPFPNLSSSSGHGKIGSKGSLDSYSSADTNDFESMADQYRHQLLDYGDAIEEAQAHFDLNEELVAQNNENANSEVILSYYKKLKQQITSHSDVSNNNDKQKSLNKSSSEGDTVQDVVDEEIDNNFNQISSCLNRLKTIGLDMNDELSQHKDMIEDLKMAISKTEEDTEKVTRIMRRFEI